MLAFLSFATLLGLLIVAIPALVIEVSRELDHRRRSRFGRRGAGGQPSA
ncbi:hypothetical protein [Methylocystis parvus]|nr:hypothetical protein [Methylocystis parvus]WBJ99445.1 hypothetical protein MMG94_15830 [Methylocystis parvus OBBP]